MNRNGSFIWLLLFINKDLLSCFVVTNGPLSNLQNNQYIFFKIKKTIKGLLPSLNNQPTGKTWPTDFSIFVHILTWAYCVRTFYPDCLFLWHSVIRYGNSKRYKARTCLKIVTDLTFWSHSVTVMSIFMIGVAVLISQMSIK